MQLIPHLVFLTVALKVHTASCDAKKQRKHKENGAKKSPTGYQLVSLDWTFGGDPPENNKRFASHYHGINKGLQPRLLINEHLEVVHSAHHTGITNRKEKTNVCDVCMTRSHMGMRLLVVF